MLDNSRHIMFWLRLLLLVACVILSGCQPYQGHNSDETLIKVFHDRRSVFDQLIDMIKKDSTLERVDYNWTSPNPPPVSAARISEYRGLLKSIGCVRGFEHYPLREGITFIASANGMATGGTSKEYFYTESVPSPLTESLDTFRPERKDTSGCVYRHIEGNWYLCYEYDG